MDRYAEDVVSGRLVAGPLVRLACQRHLRDRQAEAEPGGHPAGWRFDAARADVAIGFFETVLRLPDTADAHGDPLLFILQPWQAFIIGSLFGWVGRDDCRRFREAYIETGKGSGKTPLCAGIGLFGLVLDGEQAAEIYSAATTADQAKIMWRDAQRMVACSPELASLIQTHVNNLAYPATFSWFRPVSSEHRGLDGKRPHMGLMDEIHEHPSGIVVHKIRAGAKRRKNPLFVEITNAGFDRTSICWAHHEHSRKILEGVIEDDRWFAYVCALDEGDDPLADPACWVKTNPNLGVTPTQEYLARQVENARNIPAETNAVLRLNFCVWTQAITRFVDPGAWAACNALIPDAELEGRPCYAGLDLGETDDLSAFARVWLLEDGRLVVRMRYWLPAAALTKHPDRPYDQWQRAGLLDVTPGNITDFDQVEETVLALCQDSGVIELAYDKRFAQQMALHLQGAGVTCVDQPQGFYLNEAIRFWSAKMQAGQLCHGGDPILAWMADNAVTREGRNKDVRLDKEASKEKIDGLVAMTMACARPGLWTDPESAALEVWG